MRAVAIAASLDFVPLTWERFDLVLRQRDYFLPGPQRLFPSSGRRPLRNAQPNSDDMGGAGRVRLVN
jgi:putative molybdopterin biosynthesis protein